MINYLELLLEQMTPEEEGGDALKALLDGANQAATMALARSHAQSEADDIWTQAQAGSSWDWLVQEPGDWGGEAVPIPGEREGLLRLFDLTKREDDDVGQALVGGRDREKTVTKWHLGEKTTREAGPWMKTSQEAQYSSLPGEEVGNVPGALEKLLARAEARRMGGDTRKAAKQRPAPEYSIETACERDSYLSAASLRLRQAAGYRGAGASRGTDSKHNSEKLPHTQALGQGFDAAQQVDRAFQRDARRYDGKFTLH